MEQKATNLASRATNLTVRLVMTKGKRKTWMWMLTCRTKTVVCGVGSNEATVILPRAAAVVAVVAGVVVVLLTTATVVTAKMKKEATRVVVRSKEASMVAKPTMAEEEAVLVMVVVAMGEEEEEEEEMGPVVRNKDKGRIFPTYSIMISSSKPWMSC